jgi:hypothetical protein
VSLIASGSNSLNDIQIIAPAANHNHIGNASGIVETTQNAGIAINGCGRLEKILHNHAFRQETHLGTIVREIASHSGIFWIIIMSATKIPNSREGPNETPIAIHSANE